MSRTLRAGWACALAVLAAGCQDYNFNPVGHCVIQPGTERVTLSNISTADVLFVVDDSGSMGEEQAALATNFSRFIANLDASNAARVAAGLEPFDFHVAVTTTSMFWNYQNSQTPSTCSSSCPGAAGQLVCCTASNTPVRRPKACNPSAPACPGGTTCGINCQGLKGENYCCDQTNGSFPAGSFTEVVPCSRAGVTCGSLSTHYDFSICSDPVNGKGVAVDQWPFSQGEFVSWTSDTSANPRVLHFDKELYKGTTNRQGFTRSELISFFTGGTVGAATVKGNVLVGTCGSGEEQALQAARRALEIAAAGQQKDTYKIDPGKIPDWVQATRTARATAEWLHPNSKLVLVFVGDEDDCSSPADPSGGVVMDNRGPGADACAMDATTAPPVGGKEYPVQSFADYFTSLGRPVGAAFIFPAAQESCSADTCTSGPGLCSTAQAAGKRLLSTAEELRARGADLVLGSICDPNFGGLLDSIADLVKPPTGLELPTLPAAGEVTVLRIADASGQTRKICTNGPLAPTSPNYTLAEAQATRKDWWFTVDAKTALAPVAGPTKFVYINPQGGCIANPGETYSADYIGKLPAAGCGDDPAAIVDGTTRAMTGDEMCQRTLGGSAASWTCFAADSSNACAATSGRWNNGDNPTGTGTCICGPRASNCAP